MQLTVWHLLLVSTLCAGGEVPRDVPVERLGGDFQLVGMLHVPLGKLVTVQGVVVQGPFKGYDGGPNLWVRKIQGRPTQEDIQILISPHLRKWVDEDKPKLETGKTYEVEGYCTGQFVGIPDEVFKQLVYSVQSPRYYFHERFEVIRAKAIAPVEFSPGMFTNEQALIQGKAESRQGRSVLVGDGWSVTVDGTAPWPAHAEGRKVETWGTYRADGNDGAFTLVGGDWKLVDLADQVGREVVLRGRARSLNGVWWFVYRGTALYVEGMEKLPDWKIDNHWAPMEIRGRLEQAKLPRLDQITLKSDRDLADYYIVRGASWKPLPALLSPEQPREE
jgi:hypothetical protein